MDYSGYKLYFSPTRIRDKEPNIEKHSFNIAIEYHDELVVVNQAYLNNINIPQTLQETLDNHYGYYAKEHIKSLLGENIDRINKRLFEEAIK